jgi:hypothetical protein
MDRFNNIIPSLLPMYSVRWVVGSYFDVCTLHTKNQRHDRDICKVHVDRCHVDTTQVCKTEPGVSEDRLIFMVPFSVLFVISFC